QEKAPSLAQESFSADPTAATSGLQIQACRPLSRSSHRAAFALIAPASVTATLLLVRLETLGIGCRLPNGQMLAAISLICQCFPSCVPRCVLRLGTSSLPPISASIVPAVGISPCKEQPTHPARGGANRLYPQGRTRNRGNFPSSRRTLPVRGAR